VCARWLFCPPAARALVARLSAKVVHRATSEWWRALASQQRDIVQALHELRRGWRPSRLLISFFVTFLLQLSGELTSICRSGRVGDDSPRAIL
jgi:hypothetical protein